jgi:hypothetical protein
VKYENTTQGIFGTVGVRNITGLAPDDTIILTFFWNTTAVQPCVNYTIIAEASTVPNESDLADNTFVDGKVKINMEGDVNGDGAVDVIDISLVSLAYGTFVGEPGYDPDADLNRDGVVDMRDLYIVAKNLGKTC